MSNDDDPSAVEQTARAIRNMAWALVVVTATSITLIVLYMRSLI